MNNTGTGRTWDKIARPGPGRIAAKLIKGTNEYVGETGVKLYLPDVAGEGIGGRQGEAHIGEVVAVCAVPYSDSGYVVDTVEYPIGTIVVFNKYTGTRITIGRESAVILEIRDVLCEILQLPEEDTPSHDESSPDSDAQLLREFSSTLPGASAFSAATPKSGGPDLIPPLPEGMGDPRGWGQD